MSSRAVVSRATIFCTPVLPRAAVAAASRQPSHLRPYSQQTGYPNSNKTTNPPGKTFSKDESIGLKSEADTKQAAKIEHLKKKTQAQSDEELRQKLEEMSGDGGVAGLELEDGRPVAMKRGVAANMFRVI